MNKTWRLWLRGRASVLLFEGRWFDSPGLHVEVSLGKILNPKLLLMCWLAPCMSATTFSVNTRNINMVSVMSQSNGIKGGTTDEVFQEQCFLWERGAPVGLDLGLFWCSSSFTCRRTFIKHFSERRTHSESPLQMFVGHSTLVGSAGGSGATSSHCFLWKIYAKCAAVLCYRRGCSLGRRRKWNNH